MFGSASNAPAMASQNSTFVTEHSVSCLLKTHSATIERIAPVWRSMP